MYARESGGTGEVNPSLAGIAAIIGPTQDFEVWTENIPAFNLFQFLSTQWRVGMNGYTGLDYGVLYSKMGRMKLTPEEFDLMEADIQAMETAALKAMREKAD